MMRAGRLVCCGSARWASSPANTALRASSKKMRIASLTPISPMFNRKSTKLFVPARGGGPLHGGRGPGKGQRSRKEETMLRRFELPLPSELPSYEDDPALFDPSPEWFVPGLKASHREDEDDELDGGFRSLVERPEAMTRAWCTARRERSRYRIRSAKRRHARSPKARPTASR